MLITGLIISLIISGCLSLYCYYLLNQEKEIIQLNTERQKENKEIERLNQQLLKDNQQLKETKQQLVAGVQAQNNILQSIIKTKQQMEESAEIEAQRFYETKLDEYKSSFEARQSTLSTDINILNARIKQKKEELNNIEAKQLAYIQAQKRQEEIAANQDYYRLALDQLDLNDVNLLRELQSRFIKKESVDKLIWEVYFKPAYDILISHLFEGTKKICGIYKITDLTTNQAYIGQSVDIKERFRQHIKSALSYGKATNKLYQTMQKSGVHNFTFEVLEEVSRDKLNEREVYWIEFYKTKEFGLNSQKGGA